MCLLWRSRYIQRLIEWMMWYRFDVVQDIIDTGRTMTKLLATLADHEPKKVRVVRLEYFSIIILHIKVAIILFYKLEFSDI